MTKHLFLLTAALAVALPQAALAQHHGDHGGGGGGGHGPGPGGGAPHGPPPGGGGAPHGPPPGGGGFHGGGGGGPRPEFHGGENRPQFQQTQRAEAFRGGDRGHDRGPDRGQWHGDDHRGPGPHGDGFRGEGFRDDHRGDWRGDRGPGWNGDHGRSVYRIGAGRPPGFQRYRAPAFYYPRGYGYRRWTPGLILPSIFLGSAYYWNDWGPLGVGAPPPGYHWVRYGPDLLLVSWRSGRIADVIYGAFY